MPNEKVAVATEVEVNQKVETLPPHVVIVWNDDEHTIEFVVAVLMEVCKMTPEDATETTLKIAEEGKAAVWKGHKELAELKRDQIATFRDNDLIKLTGAPNVPLNVTIARA